MKKLLSILLIGVLFTSCGFREYDVKVNNQTLRAFDRVDRNFRVGDTVLLKADVYSDKWEISNNNDECCIIGVINFVD